MSFLCYNDFKVYNRKYSFRNGERKMEDDTVVYIQCPHCKKGWYGKFLGTKSHYSEDGKHILDEYMVQGWNPTNLTEPIHCLNCHKDYTVFEKEMVIDWENGEECIVYKEPCTTAIRMPEFVAERLTTCVGH